MSGQVSNPAISISQPLIREFLFTQPSHSSQSHWISSSVSLALFKAMAKKAGFPYVNSTAQWSDDSNYTRKKEGANVLWWWIWILNPHDIAVIDNQIIHESFVNCQRDHWLPVPWHFGCSKRVLVESNKGRPSSAPLRFLGFSGAHTTHSYVRQPRVRSLVRRLEFPPEQ